MADTYAEELGSGVPVGPGGRSRGPGVGPCKVVRDTAFDWGAHITETMHIAMTTRDPRVRRVN